MKVPYFGALSTLTYNLAFCVQPASQAEGSCPIMQHIKTFTVVTNCGRSDYVTAITMPVPSITLILSVTRNLLSDAFCTCNELQRSRKICVCRFESDSVAIPHNPTPSHATSLHIILIVGDMFNSNFCTLKQIGLTLTNNKDREDIQAHKYSPARL